MSAPRLYLLDAYALIFRAYFAFARNPRVNSKGVDTSAVYGFMLALLDVLEKEKPSHIAVVFDIGGSQAREELFPEYKANRDETPEGIKVAVPYIHQLLEAMRIPALGVPGYEADESRASWAKRCVNLPTKAASPRCWPASSRTPPSTLTSATCFAKIPTPRP
ncbi:MAG: hypothetical protein EBZ34_02170 [Flavobacteriia bacterium]|nr:hypothetical protein [Flavobacteriia bacterium]